jgi:hypothetical protein
MSRRALRKEIERLRQATEHSESSFVPSAETAWALDTYARLKHEQGVPPFGTPVAFTPEEERALKLVAEMREAG